MTLRLIYGGKGGKGPPPPPTPPSGGGRRRRRRHWLASLLWYATCHAFFPERAKTIRGIAQRMTRLSRQILGRHYVVSEQQASHVLGVVRENPLAYGTSYPHVQKGAVGEDRCYVPILTDYDPSLGRAFLVDDDDLDAIKKGAISSILTDATMLRREATALELSELIWPDEFNGVVADLRRIANSVERLAARAKLL